MKLKIVDVKIIPFKDIKNAFYKQFGTLYSICFILYELLWTKTFFIDINNVHYNESLFILLISKPSNVIPEGFIFKNPIKFKSLLEVNTFSKLNNLPEDFCKIELIRTFGSTEELYTLSLKLEYEEVESLDKEAIKFLKTKERKVG